MNIKNNFSKYVGVTSAAFVLAGTIAVTTASAQTAVSAAVTGVPISASVSANVDASTSMRGMYMRDRTGSSTMRMGSSTRMSSTTREEMMQQRQGQVIGTIEDHSGAEITARITSLNTLLTKVNAMTKLSATEKTTITTEVQGLISDLTTLQAKIQVDASSTPTGARGDLASTSPLRMDMESITKDYRVYALVIPQLDILAAADRGQDLVSSLTTLSGKLQTRITADQSAGDNVTAFQASLTDLNAKVADAQTQTSAVVTATAGLTPDNGNTTIAASNEAALKSARTDIQTADSDIKTATADAQSIVKGVEALGGDSVTAGVNASTAASVQ